MASNPLNTIGRVFPTNRRLLVKKSLNSIRFDDHIKKVLVIGSGNDPYENIFKDLDLYIKLDIVSYSGKVDIIADAHSLPFSNCCFDCIIASEVFEHLHNPELFIKEAFRVLSDKGIFVFSVPFMFHEHGDPYDYWRPTKSAINNILNEFSTVSITPQGNRVHVILDLITTIKSLWRFLVLLRIINHLIIKIPFNQDTTAPSGYFVVANK
jgi:SAM-dependent methyltransferase